MRHARFVTSAVLVAAAFLSGCRSDQATARNGASGGPSAVRAVDVSLPSGTSLDVSLTTALTSETARSGDAWTGVLRSANVLDGRSVLPAGSLVAGTITSANPARKGD